MAAGFSFEVIQLPGSYPATPKSLEIPRLLPSLAGEVGAGRESHL